MARKLLENSGRSMFALALCSIVVFGASAGVRADEADAKRLLKAMSDYLTAQKALSFGYDATLDVVTNDEQKLELASSGTVTLNRPDKIRTMRSGGFADVEMSFDGKTLTLVGKNMNIYAQADMPGTVEHLIDELRVKHNRPLPAADLLLSDPYDELMLDVVDVKDLGSGVIGGVECDSLAFRKKKSITRSGSRKGNTPILADLSSPQSSLPVDRNTPFRLGTGRLETRLQ